MEKELNFRNISNKELNVNNSSKEEDNSSTTNLAKTKFFPIFEKNFRPKKTSPLRTLISEPNANNQSHISPPLSKRLRKSLLKKDPPGKIQTVLDAGQKQIGPIECAKCGLLYNRGSIEDEEEHFKLHQNNLTSNPLTIRLWTNAQILSSSLDGKIIVMAITNQLSKRVLKLLEEFMTKIDEELGTDSTDFLNGSNSKRIFLTLKPTKRKNVYWVLCCAVVEALISTKIIVCPLPSTSSQNGSDPTVCDTQIFESGIKGGISLGIMRLWTNPSFRRQKLSTALIDTARLNSGLHKEVRREEISILEPSEDGCSFMSAYSSGKAKRYSYVF